MGMQNLRKQDGLSCSQFISEASFWVPEHMAASAWHEHAPFAFWLMGALRPEMVVELGVAEGFSYFAQCQAVEGHCLPTKCFGIDTWRGDAHAGPGNEAMYIASAKKNDARYSAFSHLIRSPFDDARAYFRDGSIDLLHIDGFHTYEAVSQDFNSWRSKLSKRAIVLFHDTNVRERKFGVWKLWDELKLQYASFEFLHGHGLGVLAVGEDIPMALKPLFHQESESVAAIRNVYHRLGSCVSSQHAVMLWRSSVVTTPSVPQPADRLRISSHGVAKPSKKNALALPTLKSATARAEFRPLNYLMTVATRLPHPLRATLGASHRQLRTMALTAPITPKMRAKLKTVEQRLIGVWSYQKAAEYCRVPTSKISTSTTAALRNVIASSGYFDSTWYLMKNPDVAKAGIDPILHYLSHGAAEGRDPSPRFSTHSYRSTLKSDSVNPLVHYCLHSSGQSAVRSLA